MDTIVRADTAGIPAAGLIEDGSSVPSGASISLRDSLHEKRDRCGHAGS